MMRIGVFEVFLRVAEEKRHTGRQTLYITQPAVSNAIAKLRRSCRSSCFFWDKRNGLLLTDAGRSGCWPRWKIWTTASRRSPIGKIIL